MSHNITVEGGTSVRLPTAGKYCDRDIVVTATGGGSIWDEEIPDDGKTRLFIHLADGRTSPMLRCYVKGTVTVDWGDGTDPDTITGTTTVNILVCSPIHKYAEQGDYIITLTVDGEMQFAGDSMYGSLIMGAGKTKSVLDFVYSTAIKKMIIGENVCVTTKTSNIYALAMLYGLSSVTILEGMTGLMQSCFSNNAALVNITLPASLTGIVSKAFLGCTGVRYIDFTVCKSVPTLVNADAFDGIPTDCEIRVPSALYDQWIAATNWSSWADYIVAV